MNSLLALHLRGELGLVLSATRIPELGPEPGEPELFSRLRGQKPEEAVMLNTNLPKSFCSTMVTQLEPDGRLKLLELSGTKFDEESVPFVRDLDNLGPSKAVNPESISINKNTCRQELNQFVKHFNSITVLIIY